MGFPSLRYGEGYKKAHPLKSGVGYKMYSTVPPWLQQALPLIDALTGAPDPEFPPDSSEAVGKPAGGQSHFSRQAPLWALYRNRNFIIAFF